VLVATGFATDACEARSEDPAPDEAPEFAFYERRIACSEIVPAAGVVEQGFEVLAHDRVQGRLLGLPSAVDTRCGPPGRDAREPLEREGRNVACERAGDG